MNHARLLQGMVGLFILAVSPLAAAAVITLEAALSGAAESPSNASPGTGLAIVTYDPVAHTLAVSATFSGLLGTTTAAHIHCCTALPLTATAGVATQTPYFVGFPIGVTAGSFSNSYDLTVASSWNAAFITANGGIAGAEAALAAGLLSDRAYFNVHTTAFPGGEIRGFLQVPEPQSLALAAAALLLLFGLRTRGSGARRG